MKIQDFSVLNNETEIKNHWKYQDRVYISNICITYNQEKYIRNTLDSMLAQKCDYRFEIIIHDDCSTDNTRSILQEYKRKYPNIINLVLQEKNQYSQGKRILPIAAQYATGEYIALCEGDDFWVDSYKLQKQLNALLKKPEIDICFTRAYIGTPQKYRKYCDYGEIEKIFTSSEVVRGGGGFMPTASLMIKTEVIKNLPQFYYDAPVGDYPLQIYASLKEGALYLPDITTFYRENALGSWSANRKKLSSDEILNESAAYKKSLNALKNLGISIETIDNVISNIDYYLSIESLNNKYFDTFNLLISQAYSITHQEKSLGLKLFYKYRKSKHLVLFLYLIMKIKRFIKI